MDEVGQRQPAVCVLVRDDGDEAQVGANQLGARVLGDTLAVANPRTRTLNILGAGFDVPTFGTIADGAEGPRSQPQRPDRGHERGRTAVDRADARGVRDRAEAGQ